MGLANVGEMFMKSLDDIYKLLRLVYHLEGIIKARNKRI